ncbi:hypothetical protein SAMN05443543_108166 [Flavobacterium flevense]|uniref:Uncharacterized protein n=1 Tax=Flavobacterium flevense TaxID=983 RepID=A0A4Y4AZK2_9FLAO|nr:hypothetical protein [Flavobacterium flevense]GEC73671.1 hypothetical protein FFL01_32100 [Flavobacterium flevense]SHL99959.1 hypothetical protein SAMN05443543_108166 [Flavobacterium flevense]
MKIYPPKLKEVGNKIILISDFETDTYSNSLWYEFDIEYKKHLVTEQSDAFVVGLLLLAFKLKEDIYIEGSISARLKYQLNYYLIPALCIAFKEFNKIQVFSEEESELILSNDNCQSATGISCGVDSLATLMEHEKMKGLLAISHLTYLNAGSHSDFGSVFGRELFDEKYRKIVEFGKEINKSVIKIDTNLSELLQMRFITSHTLRNISCILNLQKLFKSYYYASAFRFDQFEINSRISDLYDLLTLQMVSTESVRFYSSLSDKTREERTRLISKYQIAFDYLDVCVDPKSAKGKINCSKCSKCMRTQITLDVFGSLNFFNNVFDMEVYQRHKNKYISGLIVNKKRSKMDKNVWNLLVQNNYKITFLHFAVAWMIILEEKTNNLKKFVKSLLLKKKKYKTFK